MRKKSDPTFIAEFRKTENIQDVPIPKFYSNFQFNNSVLCKESFSIPKVLIIGDVSKSRVFEYTIGDKSMKQYQILKHSLPNINKPTSYYAISEEINKSIFIFGGIIQNKKGQNKFSNKLYRLSIPNKSLVEVQIEGKERPAPRVGSTLTYISEPFPHLLLFGGATEDGDFLNDLWIFNIMKLKWEEIETNGEIPPPMELHSTVLWGHCLIVIGGLIKEDKKYLTSDKIYSLDLDTVKWSILGGNLLTNRANQSALIVNDIVILYGGFQFFKSSKQPSEELIKENYISFHENLLENSKILVNFITINMTTIVPEKVSISRQSCEVIPLAGPIMFLYNNLLFLMRGITYDEDDKIIMNKNLYYCEFGAPPSPLNPIPYNINCSSFDLVWKEPPLSEFFSKRSYCIEISKLNKNLGAYEGNYIIYEGSETKCHINKVIYDDKYITQLHPDTNYKIRLYSKGRFDDYGRHTFPEIIVKTEPCEIVDLQDINCYFLERNNLFIFNWVNYSNKVPCYHTKYYLSALPFIINDNDSKTCVMDVNSTILYVGVEREICFTSNQLFEKLNQCKIFEHTKRKSDFFVLFVLYQYNLVREKPVLYSSRKVLASFLNCKFDKFIYDEDIGNCLDEYKIEQLYNSAARENTPELTTTTSNVNSRKKTRSTTSSNSVEELIVCDSINDNLPREIKNLKKNFKNRNGTFRIKLFKNNKFINLDYKYNDVESIQKEIDLLLPKRQNNSFLDNDEIYNRLESYISSTINEEEIEFSETEDYKNKFESPYTKESIKILQNNCIIRVNSNIKKKFKVKENQWDPYKHPPVYMCYTSIAGVSDRLINSDEFLFISGDVVEKKDLSLNERRAIYMFMKYNKDYIFNNYLQKNSGEEEEEGSNPDSLNSLIPQDMEKFNLNELISNVKNNTDKYIDLTYLDNDAVRKVVLINDKDKRKAKDIALFII